MYNIAKTQAIYRFNAIKIPIAYVTEQISKTLRPQEMWIAKTILQKEDIARGITLFD